MILEEIQQLYNNICSRYNALSVKVYFTSDKDLGYKGLYLEMPFRKIYLNTNYFTDRTIYHEIFHHLNPKMHDGEEFEMLLTEFIKKETK